MAKQITTAMSENTLPKTPPPLPPKTKTTAKPLKKTVLQKFLDKMKEENKDYLSDNSTPWIYNELADYQVNDKLSMSSEIIKKQKFTQFFKGNFYFFEYKPLKKGGKYFEYYDRRPFIFYLGKDEDFVYGLNLNYLYPIEKVKFLNYCFQYVKGNIFESQERETRILVNYNRMDQRDGVFWHKIIFRKYYINRMKYRMWIPKKYVKIFAFLGNENFYGSLSKIYSKVLVMLQNEKRKRFKNI